LPASLSWLNLSNNALTALLCQPIHQYVRFRLQRHHQCFPWRRCFSAY